MNGVRKEVPPSPKFNAYLVMTTFCDMYSKPMYKEDIVAQFNKAGDMLGVSVSKFAKILNAAILDAYIKPNYELIKRFAYVGGMLSHDIVKAIIKHKIVITQYIADNNEHTAAFAMLFGSTQNARKLCGKGLWKSLSRNSKTRNDKIVHAILRQCRYTRVMPKIAAEECEFWQKVPSGMLHLPAIHLIRELDNPADKIRAYLNKPMHKIIDEEVYQIYNLVIDCKRMLEDKFKASWSLKRIKEEHDKEALRLAAEKHSPEPFPYCDELPATVTDTVNGKKFTATLVRSALEMFAVGLNQCHCVGSYHSKCWEGDYVVYTITDEEGVISTYGTYTHANPYSQHYLKRNQPVKDQDRCDFVYKILAVELVKSPVWGVKIPKPPQTVAVNVPGGGYDDEDDDADDLATILNVLEYNQVNRH